MREGNGLSEVIGTEVPNSGYLVREKKDKNGFLSSLSNTTYNVTAFTTSFFSILVIIGVQPTNTTYIRRPLHQI